MSADALAETQAVFMAQLIADGPLTAALGGAHVYDAVPQGQPFPYVALGPSSARDWSGSEVDGAELTITFDVYSRAQGRKQASDIAALVADTLAGAGSSMASHALVLTEIRRVETLRLKGAKTWRARIELRALVERH